MTIKNRILDIKSDMRYNFCGIDFDLYNSDHFRIYNKLEDDYIYDNTLDNYNKTPFEILSLEYKKEELRKIDGCFTICFYIDYNVVEIPISAKANYI